MEGVPARPLVPRGLLLRPRVGHVKQPQVGSCAHFTGGTAGWGVGWWWWRAHRPLQTASLCISEIVGHCNLLLQGQHSATDRTRS